MDTAQRTAAALGIDFGTHHTVATVARADGRRHQLLFEGSPLLPSGIYLDYDASLLVGRDAAREGRRHPDRYERNPKLQIASPTILLGDKEIPVREAVAAVLGRVMGECERVAGPPQRVTVTVPAGWGPARRHVIGDAAASTGAAALTLLPEPVAAAKYFVEVLGCELAPGQAVVVFDLGAGTFDASVVARTGTGYEVLAVDGSDRIGGHYLDQALVEHLGGRYEASEALAERWRALIDPNSGTERRRLRFALYDEVRDAKERLSRSVATDIVVPGFAADELLTRAELELLARPLLEQAVAITKAVVREAGREPERLAGVFMVGGASRMPLATTMLHRELGVAPTLIEQPELVVSEGAVAEPAPSPPAPVPAGHRGPAQSPPPAGLPAAAPILPAAPAPASDRRGPIMVLGIVALAIAVLASGAFLISAYGDRSQEQGRITGVDAPTGGSGPPADETPEDADWDTVTITDVETTASSITLRTDAAPGLTDCSADVTGALMSRTLSALDCDAVTVEGLHASDDYTIELHGPGPDADPIVWTGATDTVYGTVYWDCPETRIYCGEQGGEPGIRGTADDSTPIGHAPVGEVYELVCYEVAEEITPRGEEVDGYWDYHVGKAASSLMMMIEYGDSYGYLPFVWLVVDEADPNATGGLARCAAE
ncbi:MAG TPA: Hsp70 family protein [Glycomyces sp.]|nr:Hsp70 family protein [Glycomyces sp.]